MPVTRELLANVAAAVVIVAVLFAWPLLLGAHVAVQRSSPATHVRWFGGIVALLVAAIAAGLVGLVLLG
jgi:hypothetical protein